MNRRESIKLMAAVSGVALSPSSVFGSNSSTLEESHMGHGEAEFETKREAYSVSPVFTWLRMGDVKPAGWLKEQMVRDLRAGTAGSLDRICSEAAGDIFATGQITPGKAREIDARENIAPEDEKNWWDGETEGNWRAGFMMLAYLSEDAASMRKADEFVQRVLSFQGDDGYLGIYSKELRYRRPGDLWTQACLLRGLLAYAELTRSDRVLKAVIRCADAIRDAYGPGRFALICTEAHDWMILDVFERLYDITGNKNYREFGVYCYEKWSQAAKEGKYRKDLYYQDGLVDASLSTLLDANHAYFAGHCVRTVEHIRVPLWLWMATGRQEYGTAARNAMDRLVRYAFLSGGTVSGGWKGDQYDPESIHDAPPDPSRAVFEFCTMKETEFVYQSALQKMGNAAFADRVERVFFNAVQGARLPDGSGLTYSSWENQPHCNGKLPDGSMAEARDKFSPAHSDVANCCNPNLANVGPLYVRGMWMRHQDGGLAAVHYGPCIVSTQISGVRVVIEEQTAYPFDNRIEVIVRPAHEAEFTLYFRNPEWSVSSSIRCADARVEREGDYWLVTKRWKAGDRVNISFTPSVKELVACNGEVALQYGALVFAQPIPASRSVIKSYPLPGFQDAYYEPVDKEVAELAFPLEARWNGFGFKPVQDAAAGSALRPFDSPRVKLRGTMVNSVTGAKTSVDLVPFGNAPALRRLTFPVKP